MPTIKKILVIDSVHTCLNEELGKAGFACDDGESMSKQQIEKVIHNYTGIIIRSRIFIDRIFIEKAVKLEFIGRVGSGMECIDVVYAEKKGIKCFNSPEGNRDALSEHALGMLLLLMNNILCADKQVREGIWQREENRGEEIKGKTIGIIGYGNMGSAFAQRLKGFEANVIAYDKYKTNFSDQQVKEVSLDEVFEKADILSLHLPLTEETRFFANDNFFKKFRKKIWFINTSRGTIVKTEDLVKYLKNGKIKGCALDVIEYEETSFEKLNAKDLPKPWKYLTESDKVILTPHIAGWTKESKIKLAKVLTEKIVNFMKGKNNFQRG